MAELLLAPSVWPESVGLVTPEVWACGCCVVASDRGAVGEPVVEGVNGHIVYVADSDGLTSILRPALSPSSSWMEAAVTNMPGTLC